MAAGPNDLTTLANAKQWLNITVTTDDALIQRLITAFSAAIQTYLNRTIAVTAYTENRTGTGSNTIALTNYPIQSITSLVVGQQTINASPDGYQSGYVFDERMLYLIEGSLIGSNYAPGRFPKWPPLGVHVSYSAGFTTVPFDLEQACIEVVGLRYKEKDRIGVQSKTLATETISYVLSALSQSGAAIINNYRRVVPM